MRTGPTPSLRPPPMHMTLPLSAPVALSVPLTAPEYAQGLGASEIPELAAVGLALDAMWLLDQIEKTKVLVFNSKDYQSYMGVADRTWTGFVQLYGEGEAEEAFFSYYQTKEAAEELRYALPCPLYIPRGGTCPYPSLKIVLYRMYTVAMYKEKDRVLVIDEATKQPTDLRTGIWSRKPPVAEAEAESSAVPSPVIRSDYNSRRRDPWNGADAELLTLNRLKIEP